MTSSPALTCPNCSASVRVAPVGFPMQDDINGEATGAILKRCPRCQVWSWMMLLRQEAS